MATAGVTIETIGVSFPNGQAAPTYDATPLAKEDVTTSGTSAQTTISVPAGAGGSVIWRVACESPLWIAQGSNPTASAGNDRLLVYGVIEFAATPGSKLAIIDA